MIFDLHNDLPTSGLSPDDIKRTACDCTDRVAYAYWTTELTKPMAVISRGCASGMFGRDFSVEDLGFANDCVIDRICELGPLFCTLTHNRANSLAGGAAEDACLTDKGAVVISKFNRAGIALDTAHLSYDSFFEAVERADRVINSHTALQTVCAHPRNVTDEQVRLILDRGGIIGLTAVSSFIGGDNVGAYVRLIDAFVQKFGTDGACIGTDFYGTAPLRGLSDYRSFDEVGYALEKLGYTYADVRKIFYCNANEYFKYRRQ